MSTRASVAAAPAIHDRVEAARALQASGRTSEALELLSGPGNISQDLYTLRGDLHLQLGQWHQALSSYSAAIRADGSNSDPARIGLGNCLLHLKKPEEAFACFEACRSESVRLQALYGKAVALQLLHRFDDAEALYERFLELKPASEEALANLIAMSMEVLHLSRVQQHALRLLQVSPRSVIALQALALVAVERRDYETAARYLADLQTIAPAEHFSPANENGEDVVYRLSGEEVELLRTFRGNVREG